MGNNNEITECKLSDDHTCGIDPDQDGRVASRCDACYNDAYMEGKNFGAMVATNAFALEITGIIRVEATDGSGAVHSLIANIESIRSHLVTSNSEEYFKHMDRVLHRTMTHEEFTAYDSEITGN